MDQGNGQRLFVSRNTAVNSVIVQAKQGWLNYIFVLLYLKKAPLKKSHDTTTEGIRSTGENNNDGVVYTNYKFNYTFPVLLWKEKLGRSIITTKYLPFYRDVEASDYHFSSKHCLIQASLFSHDVGARRYNYLVGTCTWFHPRTIFRKEFSKWQSHLSLFSQQGGNLCESSILPDCLTESLVNLNCQFTKNKIK